MIEVSESWAPEGAERFDRLLQARFYDQTWLFRVVRNFLVQFGIDGEPAVAARWSNLRGKIAFAASGPNTRTTQVFINLKDNAQLD